MRLSLPLCTFCLGLTLSSQGQSAFSSNNTSGNPPAAPATSSTGTNAATPANSGYDPLLDLPPLPRQPLSLIGGTVIEVDGVLNRLTVRPFGDKKNMRFGFDTRTSIFADGKPADVQSLKPGEHIYIDSQLNGTQVFAKSIRIETARVSGTGHGQIIDYDAGARILTLRDELSGEPVRFHLSPSTVIQSGNGTGSAADLTEGSLVSLSFETQQDKPVVREVSVLAKPGSSFSFSGKITFVDLSRKTIAVDNQNDSKNYEIQLASIPQSMLRNLHEGTVVQISAVFDGKEYVARNVEFGGSAANNQPQE